MHLVHFLRIESVNRLILFQFKFASPSLKWIGSYVIKKIIYTTLHLQFTFKALNSNSISNYPLLYYNCGSLNYISYKLISKIILKLQYLNLTVLLGMMIIIGDCNLFDLYRSLILFAHKSK